MFKNQRLNAFLKFLEILSSTGRLLMSQKIYENVANDFQPRKNYSPNEISGIFIYGKCVYRVSVN